MSNFLGSVQSDNAFFEEHKSEIALYQNALSYLKKSYSKLPNSRDILKEINLGCIINGVDRINFYQCHFFNKKSWDNKIFLLKLDRWK